MLQFSNLIITFINRFMWLLYQIYKNEFYKNYEKMSYC